MDQQEQQEQAPIPNGWLAAPSLKHDAADMVIMVSLLTIATGLGLALEAADMHTCIVLVYVLAVQLVALITIHRIHCLCASFASVVLYTYLFAAPRFSFEVLEQSTWATQAVMLAIALVTSFAAVALRREIRQGNDARRRDQIMLGTDRMLQECHTPGEAVRTGCTQLAKLLNAPVLWYRLLAEGDYAADRVFDGAGVSYAPQDMAPEMPPFVTETALARATAESAETVSGAGVALASPHGLYLGVGNADKARADYESTGDLPAGVMAVAVNVEGLSESERNIAAAVAGETALALDRIAALAERERAIVMAKNEQLRANLLRSISHDLRTPLTAISGNADILLSNSEALDAGQRAELTRNIRADATWLNATVENLLAITKLGNGSVQLNRTCELMDDVVEEALRHIDPNVAQHTLIVEPTQDIALVDVDTRLMVQVVVNLVNNAVSHTPAGSCIRVSIAQRNGTVACTVADNGPGVDEADRERIFESFYTAQQGAADSHRSFGLGLSLCRSIVAAHGGTISVAPVQPHGSAFTFALPAHDAAQEDDTHGV